jgi:tetratricopeptide (TPR) repeat protein
MYYLQDSLRLADSVFTYLQDNGVNDLSLQYYIGRVAFLRGDLTRAREYFLRITLEADSVIDGWMNLGMVYYEMDSLGAEIANYEKSLKHLKTLDDSLVISFSLAAALERADRFDRSVETFEFVLKHRPDHAPSLNYLGYMLAEKGEKLDYARELIEKALRISPENGAYIDSYGWLMFRMGQYNKALEQLTLAYKFINDDPVVLHHLGDAYEALDELDQARVYWRKALELDPNNEALKEKLDQ